LTIQKKINGGSKVTLATLPYDAVNHRFLSIRHDAASGQVVFETAPDNGGVPGNWTTRYSESWNTAAVPLSAVRFEIKAGTWQVEANAPGSVFFDNFKAAKTPPPPPAETVLLADDFNDNALDPAKWQANNLFSGFTDSSVPVIETNQHLEVGPLLRQVSGSHYNGLVSRQRYDFTNAYAYVAVVQAPGTTTTADAMYTLGLDVNNYYRIYEEAGTLFIQKRLNAGSKVTMWSAAHDVTQHRYWRMRHDTASGSVVFETAADNGGTPGTWTERWREAWGSAFIPLSNVLFEIKGGTWQSESGTPGKVIFDDFKAAKP